MSLDDNLIPEPVERDTDWDAHDWDEHIDASREQASDALYRHGEVTPDWKPAKREKATQAGWKALHREKGGPCRVCGKALYELHHLVGRDLGGPDVADNLVPLCPEHHRQVEERRRYIGNLLTDREMEFVIAAKGHGFWQRYYLGRAA